MITCHSINVGRTSNYTGFYTLFVPLFLINIQCFLLCYVFPHMPRYANIRQIKTIIVHNSVLLIIVHTCSSAHM